MVHEQFATSHTVAAKVAVYKWIRELATWLEKEMKAELADEMKPGDRLAKRWPDQVVMRVRPEFLEDLKRRARQFGALIDEDGEVCPWAGVRLGEPQLNTKINGDLITSIIQERLRTGATIDEIIGGLTGGSR